MIYKEVPNKKFDFVMFETLSPFNHDDRSNCFQDKAFVIFFTCCQQSTALEQSNIKILLQIMSKKL